MPGLKLNRISERDPWWLVLLSRWSHWGRVTHICASKLPIIGSDNGLSPGRHQAIIWINVGILSIGPMEINFIEILIEIETFSFKKMHLNMSSGKWPPFCLGLYVLNHSVKSLKLVSIYGYPIFERILVIYGTEIFVPAMATRATYSICCIIEYIRLAYG